MEGIFLRINEPSFILLLAYILIALNFAVLTNLPKRVLFTYLSPVFLMSAFYEMALFGRVWFSYDGLLLQLFVIGLLFYAAFGCLIQRSFLHGMEGGSRGVGGVVVLLAVLAFFVIMNWWQAGTMLLLMSLTTLLMERYEDRFPLVKSSSWIHVVSLGFAV